MKIWNGNFIGGEPLLYGESGGEQEPEYARAQDILRRILEYGDACSERGMHWDDIILDLTRDEFLALQRQYKIPDDSPTILLYPYTLRIERKE